MNKFAKKLIVAIVTVVSAVVMAISFAACGGGAELKAVYCVNPSSAGAVSYKTRPMKLIEINSEIIKVYGDGTYTLEISTDIVTGLEAVTGTGEVIDRGTTVVTYYGTYTSEEDSGLTVLKLGKPSRITFANTDALLTGGFPAGYYDTDNWQADYAETFKGWADNWLKQDPTAENILNKFSYEEQQIVVSAEGQFDYVRLSYHNVILSSMGF